MKTHADKTNEKKIRTAASAVSKKRNSDKPAAHLEDNRLEAVSQRKVQETGSNLVVQRVLTYNQLSAYSICVKYERKRKNFTKQVGYDTQSAIEYKQADAAAAAAVAKGHSATLTPTNKALIIRLMHDMNANTSTSVLASGHH